MGWGLVRNFHTRCLYQKSHSLAALARSISDTSPTRAKISYAPPAHEVISICCRRLSNCMIEEIPHGIFAGLSSLQIL